MEATSATAAAGPLNPMSNRMAARIVGLLFLAAFLTYGVGNGLVQSALTAPDLLSSVGAHEMRITLGALLMLGNSVVVATIGFLLLPILRAHSKTTAYGYFAVRIAEAILLAVGVISLLILLTISRESASADVLAPAFFETLGALAMQGNFLAYQIAMAALGFGSVFFCVLLFRAKLVPRALAVWGIAGYSVFFAGAVLELLGVGVGVFFSIPGGLFEIALGIYLIPKGFSK